MFGNDYQFRLIMMSTKGLILRCYIWQKIVKTLIPHRTQGVYSDMYMTGGLGPGNFWDTQKNKYQEKSDPKK